MPTGIVHMPETYSGSMDQSVSSIVDTCWRPIFTHESKDVESAATRNFDAATRNSDFGSE